MGPLLLPFEADINTPVQILRLTDTGNNQETDLIVAVVFSRTQGNGQVTVRMTDAAGNAVLLSADQKNGESGKAIVVPMKYYPDVNPNNPADKNMNGVWLVSALKGAKGNIVIATAP